MMKYTKVLIAINLLFTLFLVHADELPARCLPEPEDEEELTCLDEDAVCTTAEDSCCEGLLCHGYSFFKKCIPPPVCLPKWHDCSDYTDCCGDLVCALKDNGAAECDVEEIGTRTIELPPTDGNSVQTSAPSPSPPNLITTHPEDPSNVTYNVACSSGDPHIRTFDGEKYDCQADGEVILVKSWVTGREVQARYDHLGTDKAISVGRGIAMRDEGDTPLVEISVAQFTETVGNMMDDGCTLLFYINGIQHDLAEGYEDDDVVVTRNDVMKKFIITYKKTGLSATADYFKCRFNLCVTLPETDPTYGILGTSNGNSTDEWTLVDNSFIPIPADRSDKLKKPGYDFCATHMCLRDESLSLFTHKEEGADFDYFNMCDLPYGDTFEEFIEDVPVWVIDVCGHDMSCIMDVRNGDEEDARMLRLARMEYAQVCNPSGGECEDSPCCEGSECVAYGALAGSVCDGDMTCAPDMGSCENLDCCDGFLCVELNDGSHQCRKDLTCQESWMSCGDGKECCDGLSCFDNKVKGKKQCRKLPSCMKNLDDCSTIPCCGDLKCVDGPNGSMQCQKIPDCWNKQWKDCSKAPCCDGLTCIKHDGRDVCRKLPSCAKLGKSCEYIPPCESDKGPVECAEVVDKDGNTGKLARLVPGDVVVKVWNDLNANGIQDDEEPGIEDVKLAVVLTKGKDKPIVSTEEITDASGLVTFKSLLKGRKYQIKVLEAPAGAIPTLRRVKDADPEKDSNLHGGGISDSFFQTGTVFSGISLGYRLPSDVEIQIFADSNSNGVFDDDEDGIGGVHVRLVDKKKNPLESNGAGNMHEEVVTGADGIAKFTGVPQNMWIRAEVVKKPDGAIATLRNKGENDEEDSELDSNGFSDSFRISGGTGLYSKTDLGYRLPETVIVRVWDDVDRDGIQDHLEPGIAGVTLRLVTKNTKTPIENFNNGGNAHELLTTDEDGLVTFTRVPQNHWFKVEVVDKPDGAVATLKNKGDDEAVDSDIDHTFFTDSFRIETEGSYVNLDVGLSLPGSLQVRVWDDQNSDGIQDDTEPGIEGVELQLVLKDGVTTIEDQGGNSHLPLFTDAEGYVTFTSIPQGVWVRAKVLNGPEGATATSRSKGNDPEEDSNLEFNQNLGFMSSSVQLTEAGQITSIDLGYLLPEKVRVLVWDDINQNGLVDDGEQGIEGAQLKLVTKNRQDIPLTGVGNANEILTTDADGYVEFTGVNKVNWHKVHVLNPPSGAADTKYINKNLDAETEEANSDLESFAYSKTFRLSSFTGDVYNSIKLGYIMAEDITVRVWDDVNGDGIQDPEEAGLAGVPVSLTDKHKNAITEVLPGSNAHETLTTDADGIVQFVKVDKKLEIRIHVEAPPGTTVTKKDKEADQTLNNDLNGDFYTDSYRIYSWLLDGPMESIDLGLRTPLDFSIYIWEDENGNGIQDDGEPPLEGVQIQLYLKDKVTPLANPGGGSDAHLPKTSGADGIVTFTKVPRSAEFRAVVLNPPPGAVATKMNAGKSTDVDENDSELYYDAKLNKFYSDRIRMTDIKTAGIFGKLDLGMKMPKTVIARVWIDANNDGKQDDNELGFEGLQVQLVDKGTKEAIPAIEGGTAADILTTDAEGRVYFTKVPMNKQYRVKIVNPPEGYKPGKKNKGDDQLDSELNGDYTTDQFSLPNNADEFYDKRDCALIPV